MKVTISEINWSFFNDLKVLTDPTFRDVAVPAAQPGPAVADV